MQLINKFTDRQQKLIQDLLAGITVSLVLLPQSLSYAALAGMPPVAGLYAAIFPAIAAAFFASSPYLQTGPGAMSSLLVLGALSALVQPGSHEYISLAAVLALMVGVIRILIGVTRSGFIVYLMSQPVIKGFTTAAAILIILDQLPTALGLPKSGEHSVIGGAVLALTDIEQWVLSDLVLSLFCIATILAGRKIHVLFPGVLVALLVGLCYGTFGDYTGPVIGEIPVALHQVSLQITWHRVHDLIIPAFIIALVGFAEPASIARSLAARERHAWSANREFVSQGVANIAAGLAGGFCVGGSLSRTMLNYKAGASTRFSGAVAGVMVLCFLPFTDSLAQLPRAILAATVITFVIGLVDFRSLYEILRASRPQGFIAILTFVMTVALAPRIDLAIMIGIAASICVHLWREHKVDMSLEFVNGVLYLQPLGVLFFGSSQTLEEALITALSDQPDAHTLVVDLRNVGRIDYTGAQTLLGFFKQAKTAGLAVKAIPGINPQSLRILRTTIGETVEWLDDAKSVQGAFPLTPMSQVAHGGGGASRDYEHR